MGPPADCAFGKLGFGKDDSTVGVRPRPDWDRPDPIRVSRLNRRPRFEGRSRYHALASHHAAEGRRRAGSSLSGPCPIVRVRHQVHPVDAAAVLHLVDCNV